MRLEANHKKSQEKIQKYGAKNDRKTKNLQKQQAKNDTQEFRNNEVKVTTKKKRI